MTFVRARHIAKLRERIGANRAAKALSLSAFTDPTLAAGSTLVKAQHISELRDALAHVYAAAGRAAPTYTNVNLDGAAIRAIDVAELRAAVAAIERPAP